jgi:hypothetical protein
MQYDIQTEWQNIREELKPGNYIMLTASCLKSLSINHMPYLNNKPHVKIIEALVKILGDLAGIMTTQCN